MDVQRTSKAAGRNEQSSRRKDTNPGSGAVSRLATIYSIDFLSRIFCERSKNCRLFAWLKVTLYSAKVTEESLPS